MKKLEFRPLKAGEIEVRINMINDKGLSLLLYKDARCDMNILDETVGAFNWKREHTRENANCIVSIWDDEKKQWVSKEDTGTESYTEKEKGLASDSFKRACFNWGIGRELYTAPFIWVPTMAKGPDGKEQPNYKVEEKNGKFVTRDRFVVTYMRVEDGKIVALNIENANKRRTVYVYGNVLPDYVCCVCGRAVRADIAEKSMEANGKVYCSGTCRDKDKRDGPDDMAEGIAAAAINGD